MSTTELQFPIKKHKHDFLPTNLKLTINLRSRIYRLSGFYPLKTLQYKGWNNQKRDRH